MSAKSTNSRLLREALQHSHFPHFPLVLENKTGFTPWEAFDFVCTLQNGKFYRLRAKSNASQGSFRPLPTFVPDAWWGTAA